MSLLEIHDLQVRYPNGHEALKSVRLSVDSGEMIAIIGRSGAGKSTLLRCINGLQRPTAGTIAVNGDALSKMSDAQLRQVRRRIGFVYQDYNLIDRSSAFRNVIAGRLGHMSPWRSVLGLFPAPDRLLALTCLDRVQLLHKAAQRADQLSGGEKQRVSIARALAQEPLFILADEPVASLDPELAREVMGFLRKAATEQGLPVLVNIHDVVLAQEYADRIVGIAEGTVVYDGAPTGLTADVLCRIYRRDPSTLVLAASAQTSAASHPQEARFGNSAN